MLKRVFDIVGSFVGLIILSPLLLVLFFLIKIKMPGPAFFCQKRVGKHGKLFTIYKFRSMNLNDGKTTVSVRGDIRITPLGERLRKYKLDELPELWNVLRGDMSFVGPRPDMPEYYNKLKGEERKILELRPGITGPASLKYANEEELLASAHDPLKYNDLVIWPDKVRINLNYFYNRTVWGDIGIIIKTILRKDFAIPQQKEIHDENFEIIDKERDQTG